MGVITGHHYLRKHLHTIGVYDGPIASKVCGDEKQETSSYIIFDCEAMNHSRYYIFGATKPEYINLREDRIRKLKPY